MDYRSNTILFSTHINTNVSKCDKNKNEDTPVKVKQSLLCEDSSLETAPVSLKRCFTPTLQGSTALLDENQASNRKTVVQYAMICPDLVLSD